MGAIAVAGEIKAAARARKMESLMTSVVVEWVGVRRWDGGVKSRKT